MWRLTRSTTSGVLNLFLMPWAIRPSISGTYGPVRAHLDLEFGAIRARRVEDGLDALLLAALRQAPVLCEVDGDPLARDDVGIPPHPRIADEHDTLLGVVVLGAAGCSHAAVAGDDPDIAGGHHALDAVRFGVRIDFHPVGVLDRVVLPGHDAPFEDRQPFLLHALEGVGVDNHRSVLALGRRLRGPGRGTRLPRPLRLDRPLLCGPHSREQDSAQEGCSEGGRRNGRLHDLPFLAGDGPAGALAPPKVAVTRPRTSVISSLGRTSRPVPLTTPPPL